MADNWLIDMLNGLNQVPSRDLTPEEEDRLTRVPGAGYPDNYFKPGPAISSDYIPMAAESAMQSMPVPGANLIPDIVNAVSSGSQGDQGSPLQPGLQQMLEATYRPVSSSPSPREVKLAETMHQENLVRMVEKQRKADAEHNAQILGTINQILSTAGASQSDTFVARGNDVRRGDGSKVEGKSFSKLAAGTSERASRNRGYGNDASAQFAAVGIDPVMSQLLAKTAETHPEVAAQIVATMQNKSRGQDPSRVFSDLVKSGMMTPDTAAMIMGIMKPESAGQADILRQLLAAKDDTERQAIFQRLISGQ